ncbi:MULTISPECIES: M20 family metallopeptidase [Pseudoalteromonas]|uniref:Peptidase M20 family protein n=1 Tax=Pseudoalteromonas luteoviolacea (strain 2ta16) TaxID=1353533 RepID=V4I000_PSEL2|nr:MULTISPECIES: M20 family metallopeptidase [Pseudoalteromonas]ESP95363.1 peptidase M20 family protein [Pseudoalteromonas luteoviolacea 2ta16]KZN42175.1 peptidase M20 [Pseudoalteromonas luteoviolacea NCIMB 1944]MCG7547331.1 M20 family metallopeptidase [Pseudoalteromonas sp. Of7M-16]
MNLDYAELADLIRCNSHSKNKAGVDRHGEQMVALAEPLGFSLTRYQRELIGDHLLFRSARNTGKRVLLLGHLDTVFPDGSFTEFHEDDNYVYGPGVCDMKGGNWVALNALRQLKQQFGQLLNIDWLLVSDEEIGSDDSQALTTKIAKQYDACFVFEAAGKSHELVVARKGIATYHITVTGKPAHAGNHYRDGIDANFAMANMLLEMTSLTDLKAGSTVNVGKVQGGIGANTISGKATLQVEARFTNQAEQQRLLEGIENICMAIEITGVEVDIQGGLQRGVMAPTSAQQALLEQINEILGEEQPIEHRGGVSDANTAAATGTPTLDGFGPYGDGDHTRNERALKRSFELRIAQMTAILSQLCYRTQAAESAVYQA